MFNAMIQNTFMNAAYTMQSIHRTLQVLKGKYFAFGWLHVVDFVNSDAINTDLFIDCGYIIYAIPCDQMSQRVENLYLSSSSS